MIYFIQPVDGGLIKIGYAADVLQRFRCIQTHSPVRLKILKVVQGGRLQEKQIHKKFVNLISHGEWFFPESTLLQSISELPGVDFSFPDTIKECCHITDDKFKCRRYTESSSSFCKVHDLRKK